MTTDIRGLTLTGASAGNAAAYNAIVQDYLDYRLTAFPALKVLCEEAPEFPMAHLLKGFLMMSMGTRGIIPAALKIAAHVETMTEALTPREQSHLAALKAWAGDDMAGACYYWDQVLFAAPLDVVALKLQHFLLFWQGQANHMRDVVARVLPAWDQATPGLSYVQGMYAFGLEETGDYSQAERLGRRAAEQQPDDLWAIHAVAHVYEMQGDLKQGISWLNQPIDRWDDRNPFKDHLWWHTAMFAFEKGEYARVLDLYDAGIWPEVSSFYLDVQNAASMLARLEFAGVDVGDRWKDLADVAVDRQGDHVLFFTEPHYTMALGRTGQFDQTDRQIGSLRQFAVTSAGKSRQTIETVVTPLCQAIVDFHKGNYAAAVDRMMPIRYDHQPIGGSHAQRDIFAIYLVDAAIRSGNFSLARSLLSERLAHHPNSHSSWGKFSEVCEQLEDPSAAAAARERMADIVSAA